MKSIALIVPAIVLLVAGCVEDQSHRSPSDVPPERIDSKVVAQKSEQIHLDAIRDMMDKGQDYAALAHLQELKQHGDTSEDVILMEADCRRHLGQLAESDQQYRRLLNGRLAGQAYHGLGLLYVRTNSPFALTSLRRAAQLLPTDADVRNDYGRALMESGRYNEAMPELSTAAELAPDQTKSRKNLIVLMILLRNEPAVTQLAQQSAINDNGIQKLREQASRIKTMQAAKPAANG